MEDQSHHTRLAATAAAVPASSLSDPLLLPGKAADPTGDGDDDLEAQLTSYHTAGASFSRTCLNLTNAVSGIGVLSMPYAVAQGGWLSLALFALVGAVSYYTGTLIARCMRAGGPSAVATYPDIGHLAFGAAGRRAVASFMYLELYLVAVSFLVLEGDNLDKLFPGASIQLMGHRLQGKQLFVALASAVVLPTTWLRDLGALAYVSAAGLVASAALTASLVWAAGAAAETGSRHRASNVLNLGGLPTSLGLYFVCFTGHAVYPTIYSSMKNSRRFPKVLLVSSALCTLNYGLTAALGYMIYGDDVQSQVTLNLPAGELYSKVAIVTTLINPLAKYALLAAPLTAAIEERLSVPAGGQGGHQHRGRCQHGGSGLHGAVLRLPHVVHRVVPQRHGDGHIPLPLLPQDPQGRGRPPRRDRGHRRHPDGRSVRRRHGHLHIFAADHKLFVASVSRCLVALVHRQNRAD